MSSEDLYDRTVTTGEIYHLYNRGVAKQPLFADDRDYEHFLLCLSYYIEAEPAARLSHILRSRKTREQLQRPVHEPIVQVHAYCLMPNHFHLVAQPLIDGGVSTWLRRACNSYTRYYNTRHHRVGSMFQGRFRFVRVGSDQQFLHLTRYVHLNPVVAKLTQKASAYRWSSMDAIMHGRHNRLADSSLLVPITGNTASYESFVNDHASYATDLAAIRHTLIDGEE